MIQYQNTSNVQQNQIWRSYLIFFNIQKKKNLGTLIRSAAAFNVSQIFYIDSSKNPKKFNTFGSQGTSSQMIYRTFPNLKSIKQYCIQNNIRICGIQIMQQQQQICKPINLTKFTGSTAFMLGNQQNGLNSNQKQICDFFTYIPQYSNKTACLNVAVAGSIILYNFAINSGLKQQQIVGQKFDEEVEEEEEKKQYEELKSDKHYKKAFNIKKMIVQDDGKVVEDFQSCIKQNGNGNQQGLYQDVELSDVNWMNSLQGNSCIVTNFEVPHSSPPNH